MYIPTTFGLLALGGSVTTSYWFYTKIGRWYSINNISDIRQPCDAVILLQKCSSNSTSCDELNEALLKVIELVEPSDKQIQYIHSMYCYPPCPVSDYSLTVIWALITWKYPTRVAKLIVGSSIQTPNQIA